MKWSLIIQYITLFDYSIWYENERELAINGKYLQVIKHAKDNEINANNKSNKCIKRWIIALKEKRRRSEKHEPNDIRVFIM